MCLGPEIIAALGPEVAATASALPASLAEAGPLAGMLEPMLASALPASLAEAGPLAGMLEPLLAAGLPESSAAGAGLFGLLGGAKGQKLATMAGLGLLNQPRGQMMPSGSAPRPQQQPTPSSAEILGNLYPQLRGPNINNGTMGIDPQLLQLLLGGR